MWKHQLSGFVSNTTQKQGETLRGTLTIYQQRCKTKTGVVAKLTTKHTEDMTAEHGNQGKDNANLRHGSR